MTRRRWLVLILGLAVSVLFVFLTLRKVDTAELTASMATVHVGILSLSLLTKLGGFVVMTLRSQLLLRPLHRYSFWRQFVSILLGFVGNAALPFRAGELLRVGYLARVGGVAPSSVLGVVALERLLDTTCLLMVFLATLPLMVVDLAPGAMVYVLAAVLCAGVGASVVASRFPEQVSAIVRGMTAPLPGRAAAFVSLRVERFAHGLSGMASVGGVLGALGLSVAYWTFGFGSAYIWLWAFGLDLPWFAAMVIVVFIAFGTLLPSAPSFVGTYHYFAAAGLAVFGVAEATCVSFSIVGHAMAFVPFALLGIPIVFSDLTLGLREQRQ